jgi:hypothetical protein
VQVEGAWLTELEDYGSPRPGAADLFFVRDAEQSVVKRPDRFDVVKIDPLFLKVLAGCVLLSAALIVVGMVNSRLRRRAKPPGAG